MQALIILIKSLHFLLDSPIASHPNSAFFLLHSFALSRAFQSSAIIPAAVSHALWTDQSCTDLLTKTFAVTGQPYWRGGDKKKKSHWQRPKQEENINTRKQGKEGRVFLWTILGFFVKLAPDQAFHLHKSLWPKNVQLPQWAHALLNSPHDKRDRYMTHARGTTKGAPWLPKLGKCQKKGNSFQHLLVTNNAHAVFKSVISFWGWDKRLVFVHYNQSRWLMRPTETFWLILMLLQITFKGEVHSKS